MVAHAWKPAKPTLYAVVRVNGELKVMTRSEATSLQKKLRDDFKIAMKEYDNGRREAAKKRGKFGEPRPTMPKVSILRSNFKSLEAAEAYRDIILKRLRERETR